MRDSECVGSRGWSTHVSNFATDDRHFEALDMILARISRPVRPNYILQQEQRRQKEEEMYYDDAGDAEQHPCGP